MIAVPDTVDLRSLNVTVGISFTNIFVFCAGRNLKKQHTAWRVRVWLPLDSPRPLSLSSLSLWAHVCFCSPLQPAWVTMMILTKRRERSRLAGKLPQSNQPCLFALTVWALCPCRHLAISPCFFLFLSFSVFTQWGRCVSGRIGSSSGGGGLPRFEVWALTGSWTRAGDLKAPSATAWVTFQHRPAWPNRVLVCLYTNICLWECVCECVWRQWVSASSWLQLSARTAGCCGLFASAPKGLPFVTWKTESPNL